MVPTNVLLMLIALGILTVGGALTPIGAMTRQNRLLLILGTAVAAFAEWMSRGAWSNLIAAGFVFVAAVYAIPLLRRGASSPSEGG